MTERPEQNQRDRRVLAFDLGGTKIAAALVAGRTVQDRRQIKTPTSAPTDDLVAAMSAMASDWRGAFDAVGIAATGVIRAGEWHPINRSMLSIPAGFPLVERLEAVFGCRARAVNDAQAAAWAEYDTRSDDESLLFVTISTGIGGGLVEHGRLVEGSNGLAGSVGHIIVRPDNGRRCGCGAIGCIETEAGGMALKERAEEVLGAALDPPALFERARSDRAAALIIDDALNLMSQALLTARRLVDPYRIVIGGGIGLRSDVLKRLQATSSRLAPDFPVRIEAAQLGADAGLVGCALLAAGDD
ncbi:MAG: ROK family protein [Pseudomonadota bacterium]